MRPDPEHRKAPPAANDQFKPHWKINWVALAVIAGIIVVLALISPVAGLVGALLIALLLVAGNAGTGQWIEGSIGDDTNAAMPKRDNRPPDY
jgi:hypothetical protein